MQENNIKYQAHINLDNKNSNYTLALEKIEKGSKVLDVGCASGMIGEFLKIEKKCDIVGIDNDEEFIDLAKSKRCYVDIVNCNLDQQNIDALLKYKGYFDYIILLDIVEHVYNPQEVINLLKTLLKPNGVFIFSVPNISHGSLKLKLLNNKFEYTEMGLLDRTHIRFFTLGNLIDLMNKTNLKIKNLERSFSDFWNTGQSHNKSDYPVSVLKYVSKDLESYTYQYIVIANLSNIQSLEVANRSFLIFPKNQKLRLKEFLKITKVKLGKKIERFFKSNIRNKFFKKQ